MSFDKFDRHTMIAFSMGVIVAKGGFVLSNVLISREIDEKLVMLHQPVMSQTEREDILDQLDNMMYLFRLENANRGRFRKDVSKF